MRTTILCILFCMASMAATAQQTCSSSNVAGTQTDQTVNYNSIQHITGYHILNSDAQVSCTYTSMGTQWCAGTSITSPSASMYETGKLQSWPIGYHVDKWAVGPGQGAGVNGAAANSTGAAAGAVEWCYTNSCIFSVTVSANGTTIGFPSGAVWTHSANYGISCGAVQDPTYNNGGSGLTCNGNPSFTCCDGSNPQCESGQYTCGGSCSCNLDGPFPTDCTAGQSVQCTSGGWQCVGNPGTPIVIDTDGHGFHLTSGDNGVVFDLSGDGHPKKMSWTEGGSTNGWLALPASDGTITSGKQLFGNFTSQPPSNDPNGFLALAVYDQPDQGGNSDGVIDSNDAIWSKLRIWIDANHDGIAQPGELYTLPSLGINSLGLQYTESKRADEYGNLFRYKGKVNPDGQSATDHVDRNMYDVFLVWPAPATQSKIELLKDHLDLP